ncbi:DUF3551 domain-containing protein [Bradyrhizobium sp. GCM10027634]|uniref:DUF3551 domain-containing protein n=1 Tax=unclassified Bradyrhizobium TaxID=2631580 RepID=UPI00188ABE09|nr:MULTISPECIES: DUF3551 domain-containing protein [unclassified Bradyrhizobium]MDN4999356.1 DUF3551 domain-containing protein [Bradyrhizobium sp. WYCCWR 12677]QOZ43702.1 hypothetical protein XH89_09565 [Bradyrhizobium sp. CCBAU 53340]
MRIALLSLVLLVIGSLSGHAQTYDPRYPVCMKLYEGSLDGGEWIDCSYTSMPECRASASGRPAMCEVNPYFTPAQRRPFGSNDGNRRHY